MQVVSPAPRAAWRELLATDPTATIQQTPEWVDAICRLERYQDASRLYHTDSGRRVLLPLVRRSGPGGARMVASLPRAWGTCGLVAPGGAGPQDVAMVWEDLAGQPVALGQLSLSYVAAAAWDAVPPPAGVRVRHRTTHVLDLAGGWDRVWSERFKSTARGAVRKAERSGLEVECDTTGQLAPVYHQLYLSWTTRRAAESGLPPAVQRWRAAHLEPAAKHRVLAETLGGACQIKVAWLHGRPAAAVILLTYGAHAAYWRGYSDKALAGPTQANNLLQRLAIEDACRAGCRWYNMGESGGVTSLMAFKASHGALPNEIPSYLFGWPLAVRLGTAWPELRRRLHRVVARRAP